MNDSTTEPSVMHDDGPMRLDDPQDGASKRGQGRSNMIGTRPLQGQAKQQEKVVDKTTYSDMHDAVIGKYRGRSVFFSTLNLVGVALSVLLIGKSALSNFWILLVLAISSFLIYLQSLNASNSYIEEAQRLMRQEEDAKSQSKQFSEPESAEWLNDIIAKLIPIMNTDLLLPMMDILEDAMKNRFPNIISAVRVEEIDLGITPFRVRKMTRMDPTMPISKGHEPEEDNSRYANLEVEFGYDGTQRKQASDNIHMLIWVAVGVDGIATAEVPVFAEVSAASGSVRTRVELISDPPFVKNATMSFPKMPEFTLSARPLRTLNVMRLPLLSDYVHYAITDIVKAFLAPNAFTLDVSRLIMGQDVDLTTHNKGIVVIAIHSAREISNTDSGSKSDPFVIVTWAKLGKVLYKTRVIRNELNPQWEEVCFALVPPDALNEGERLGLTVWDSDRITADDSLGTVDVDLNDLFEKRGKMETYERPLSGAIREANNKGTLKFSAGYFEGQDLKSGSQKAPAGTTIKMKVGGVAAPLVDDSESQKRAGNYADRIRETIDAKLPPSSKQVSGILAIQIHQMADLEITRNSLRKHGADSHTPSTYAQIFVNDEHVFSTRLKRLSSSPYINAKTEVFCRDWTQTRVDIVIMDYREREEDAVVGIIAMRLVDLLSASSQATAWRPILGGIGTGRCRVSVLFMPVNISIPQSLRGWNTGNLLIDKIIARNISPDFKGAINIRLSGGKRRVTSDTQSADERGRVEWRFEPPLRFPLLRRYQRDLQLRLQSSSHQVLSSNTISEGTVWLANLHDDAETTVEVGLYEGDEAKRRRQNNDTGLVELKSLGTLEERSDQNDTPKSAFLRAAKEEGLKDGAPVLDVTVRFSRGLAEGHSSLIGDVADPSLQEGLRMREYTIKAGERQAGSARFATSDRKHKIQRQRWVEHSRQARAPPEHRQAEADKPRRDANNVHLGALEQEEGGGLTQESEMTDKAPKEHELSGHSETEDREDWEDAAAKDLEEHEERKGPTWFTRQKVNLQNDRMNERGIYQAKVARTGKWLKDASVKKYKRTKRLISHGETQDAPEQEGISSL